MLVLGRKPGGKIIIECPNGDAITLTLIRISPYSAWLGIDAPSSYNIAREELLHAPYSAKDRTKECSENRPASDASSNPSNPSSPSSPVTPYGYAHEEFLAGDDSE
jgi:sRNA-binding carbon storage regulator CsrA